MESSLSRYPQDQGHRGARQDRLAPGNDAAPPTPDFRALFQAVPGLYLVLTPDFRIVAASDAYLDAIMKRREEILGRDLFEVFPDNPQDPGATGVNNLRGSLERVLRSGAPDTMAIQQYDIRRPTPRGAEWEVRFWIPVNSPVFGEEGEIHYLIHRVEDVTDFVLLTRQENERSRVTEELRTRAVQMEAEIFTRAQQLQEVNQQLRTINEELIAVTRAADSARKVAERQGRRLTDVLESITDAFFAVDERWRATYVNGALEQMTGRKRHELLGSYWWDEFPDAVDTPFADACRRAMRKRVPVEVIDYFAPQDRWYDLRAFPTDDGGLAVYFQNITERKRAEEIAHLLAEADRVLASALDSTPTLEALAQLAVPMLADFCFFVVVGPDRAIRDVIWHDRDPERRRRLEQMQQTVSARAIAEHPVWRVLRTGSAELVPEVTNEWVQNAAADPGNAEFLRALEARSLLTVPLLVRDQVLGALTFGFADSERHYTEVNRDLAEELARRAAVAIDNAVLYRNAETARQAAEAAQVEAETANRAESQFLATMSHEIRTPINAIMGYGELLEMGIAGKVSEAQRNYLERIKASSTHLMGLINDVLDLSKIEAGELTVRHERNSLGDVVAAALAMIGPQATMRGIEISREHVCDGADTLFLGDEDRVRQILVNLLSNAVKFTDAGEKVEIRCRADAKPPSGSSLADDERWVAVEVEDTGIGISDEQIEQIFSPFMQVDQGHTRQQGGTGLGLTISRQFALMMGGDLSVRSRVGEGSTFTLWLPAVADASSPAPDRVVARGLAVESLPAIPGLTEIGELLAENAEELVTALGDRLRADPAIPHANSLNRAELENHVATFLLDIGKSLVTLDEGRAKPALLRDSSVIQRLISERHGKQRARLGWRKEELKREFGILREEVDALVRRDAPPRPGVDVEEALGVIHHLLKRAEEISLAGFSAYLADPEDIGP